MSVFSFLRKGSLTERKYKAIIPTKLQVRGKCVCFFNFLLVCLFWLQAFLRCSFHPLIEILLVCVCMCLCLWMFALCNRVVSHSLTDSISSLDWIISVGSLLILLPAHGLWGHLTAQRKSGGVWHPVCVCVCLCVCRVVREIYFNSCVVLACCHNLRQRRLCFLPLSSLLIGYCVSRITLKLPNRFSWSRWINGTWPKKELN